MKKNNIINEKIKASKVVLIDSNGDNLGLIETKKALEKAQLKSMDLVMVSPVSSETVVCKILDFGKYIFDKRRI